MLNRFYHESSTQFTDSDVANIVRQYGKDVLIGGDPGWGDSFEAAMAAVDKYQAYKHVYLVGPGMEDWSAEEAAEIKVNARSVGIDTSSGDWRNRWYKQGGWLKKVKAWWLEYGRQNYYSAEIDNIDGALNNNPDKLVAAYKQLRDYCDWEKIAMKLMVKNLSEDELRKLISVKDQFDGFFCEFGMFEQGSGEPREQIRLAKQLGITAVTPINGLRDTHNYGTSRSGIPYSK